MGALWCLKGAVALKAEKLQGSSVLDPQLLSMAGAPRTEHCFSGFGFLPEHFASPDSSLTFSNFPEYLSLPPLSGKSVHQMERDTGSSNEGSAISLLTLCPSVK